MSEQGDSTAPSKDGDAGLQDHEGTALAAFAPHVFELLEKAAETSAGEVLPMVFELVRPSSVVDVGCWTGGWLAVALKLGVSDFLGVDAPMTDRSKLKIPEANFFPWDLNQPLRLERNFDLAISLEVAEHLGEYRSQAFVESLTSLAPVVLFSAAIPGQGGTGHVNEQWPAYWIDRFEARGWTVLDSLRGRLWCNERVAHFYSQNLLLFASPEWMVAHPDAEPGFGGLPLVHPQTLRLATQTASDQSAPTLPLRELLRRLPGATAKALRRRLPRN